MDNNIVIEIEDTNTNTNTSNDEYSFEEFIQEIKNIASTENDDYQVAELKHYDCNYTVKELHLIAEYYGLLKLIKSNKLKKIEIIEQILLFENDIENVELVNKRKRLWSNLQELKNDNVLSKYILSV